MAKKKSFWEKVGDTASRVYDQVNVLDNNRTYKQRTPTNNQNVIKQIASNSLASSPRTLGEGFAAGFSPDVKAAQASQARLQEINNQALASARRTFNNPSVDIATRQRNVDFYNKTYGNATNANAEIANDAKIQIERTNPVRMGAATIDAGLTVATAPIAVGGSIAARTAGKEALIQSGRIAGAKVFTKEIAKEGAKVAAISAPSGAASTLVANPDADVKDIIKGAATAAAVGSVTPLAFAGGTTAAKVAAKGVVNGTTKAASKVQQAFTKVKPADDIAAIEAPVVKAVDNSVPVIKPAEVAPVDNLAVQQPKPRAVQGEVLGVDDLQAPSKRYDPVAVTDNFKDQAGAALLDRDYPLLRVLDRMEKQSGDKTIKKRFLYNSGLQSRANSIANAKMQGSVELKAALEGLNNKQVKEFNAYTAARAEKAEAVQGMKTSLPEEQLDEIIATGAEKYGERFTSLNQYYKGLAEEMHKGGLIDDATLKGYLANDDYARIQRNFDDVVGTTGTGGNAYSRGTTSAKQKRTGSTREVQPADQTAFQRTQQIQKEIQSNQTASDLIDTLTQFNMAKPLVTAANVNFRKDMYKFLLETREGANFAARSLKGKSRELKVISRELDLLNKQGLDESLKKTAEPSLRGKLADPSVKMTSREVRNVVTSLVAEDSATLARIRAKIERRNPKAAALIDQVTELQDTSDAFKAARSEAWRAAQSRADQSTTHKNTIKRIVNGVPEVYEIAPEIKKVVDNIKPYELGVAARIIAAPARVLRAGTTGLSAPFTIANWFKDEIGSAINSAERNVLATTHSPANIARGLKESVKDFTVGNNSEEWQRFIAHAGDTTQYDLTRNVRDSRQISRELRFGQKGRAANAVMHPIKTLEDLNSITEKSTRFQNYKGIYDKVYKETGDADTAQMEATLAGWQNSVDFNRAGDAARAMNLLIPYFNAGIQGTRQLGRSFMRDPAGTSAKVIAGVTMPLIGLTVYNNADPERKAVYDNISEFEKDNNFIFIPPNTKQNKDGTYNVWKIPMPPGFKDLAQPSRRMVESFANKSPLDFAAIAGDLSQVVSGPINTASGTQFLGSVTPQALKPAIQQYANKDLFTGKDIVPDYINNDTDANGNPIAEKDKKFDYSSGSARAIAGVTGTSPIRVEKFVKDTFGKVGEYGENAVDNVLAKTNKIPDEQVGGASIPSDITRRFSKASSNYNYQKSDGGKYFDDVAAAKKGLNGNEKSAFDTIHPQRSNSLGDKLGEKSIIDAATKAAVYTANPKVLAADKALDAKQRQRGNPGNPFFDLPAKQQQTILSLQANKAWNPGDNSMSDVTLKQNPWIQDYYDKSGEYFDAIGEKAKKNGKSVTVASGDPNGIPKPKAPDNLDTLFDQASQFQDPKQKAEFYGQHPELTSYLAQNTDYNRAKRSFLGLPQLDRYPEPTGDVKAAQDKFFTITDKKAKSTFLKSNPALTDYWLKKNLYSLADAGSKARYEGESFSEDDFKDINSIASAMKAKSGGGYGGGSGGGSGGSRIEKGNLGSVKSAPGGTVKSAGARKVAIKRRGAKSIKITRKKIA